MRTTLDIDEDVLSAAKELAAARRTTAGRVLSELAREALTRPAATTSDERNGFPLLPATGTVITPELVHRLLDEDP